MPLRMAKRTVWSEISLLYNWKLSCQEEMDFLLHNFACFVCDKSLVKNTLNHRNMAKIFKFILMVF